MAYTERKYDSGKMRRKYERGKGSGGTYGTYEKGTHRLEVMSHYYGKRIQQDMSNFVKWILLALLIGGVVGGASSLFALGV